MSIYHDKIELVDYTLIRYRAVFIFIWECTRLLPNETYSVSVKYILDYKVKFLRYTRTYNIRRGMIFFQNSLNDLVSFRFVSQFAYFVSLRRISFRFVVFCFVSHFTGTPTFATPSKQLFKTFGQSLPNFTTVSYGGLVYYLIF